MVHRMVATSKLPCKFCSRSFIALKPLRQHLDTKHPSRIFCESCGDHFQDAVSLRSHHILNRTESKGAATFEGQPATETMAKPKDKRCTVCHRYFNTSVALGDHIWAKHNRIPKTKNPEFECFKCCEDFKNLPTLHVHQSFQYPPCPSCICHFPDKEALEAHQRAEGHMSCTEHQLKFVEWSEYSRHMASHQGVDLVCGSCHAQFPDTEALVAHQRMRAHLYCKAHEMAFADFNEQNRHLQHPSHGAGRARFHNLSVRFDEHNKPASPAIGLEEPAEGLLEPSHAYTTSQTLNADAESFEVGTPAWHAPSYAGDSTSSCHDSDLAAPDIAAGAKVEPLTKGYGPEVTNNGGAGKPGLDEYTDTDTFDDSTSVLFIPRAKMPAPVFR